MGFSLRELEALAARAGIPQPAGLPLRALIASVAKSESDGDPNVGAGDKGASFGLLQVNAPTWPDEAEAVQRIMAGESSDEEKAIAQIRAVAPIIRKAAATAGAALSELKERGFPVLANPVRDFTILFDAAWQHSPGAVVAWSRKTKTGNPLEIDPRGSKFSEFMRTLSAPGFGASVTVWELFVFLGAGALALWVLSHWVPE